jgi:hypothetical protein
MRLIETKMNKSNDKEVYVLGIGMEEAQLLQRAMENVYIAIPKGLLLLQPTKQRAWSMFKVLAKITGKF